MISIAVKDGITGVDIKQEGDEVKVSIPLPYRYLGEVLDELPKGCFINKTLTGSGGSTLAILENTKTVLAVPRLLLVHNKTAQHPYLFGVHGDVSQTDLELAVLSGTSKFISTFDSLDRLVGVFGDKVGEYNLLVDEVHALVRESGEFRASVCNRLMSNVSKFKSVTYLTATPTVRKYLPPALASIPFVTIEWECATRVDIKKFKVNSDLNVKAMSVVLDILDGDKGVPFLFYNSLTGIISLVKSLQKIRKYTSKDIKIICANTPENVKRLANSLGKDYVPQSPVTVDEDGNRLQETSKVVFVTKACFEGVDFYCQRARTIIISDAKRKHKDFVKLDICIDLPQVIGRFRDQLPEYKKEVIFLWTESFDGHHLSEDEYKTMIEKQISEAPTLLEQYENNFAGAQEGLLYAIKSSIYYIEHNEKFSLNNLAYYAMMSAYEAQKADFHVQCDDGRSEGEVKLDGLFNTTNTFSIPDLSVVDKSALNRTISYQKLLKEYCVAKEDDDTATILHLEELAPDIPDIYEVLGAERIEGYGYKWKVINEVYMSLLGVVNLKNNKQEVVNMLSLKEGLFYSLKELKEKMQNVYTYFDVQAIAKATDVIEYYPNIKQTNRRGQRGFLILESVK